MIPLARQALIVIYQVRFPADPTWPPGPLPLQEGQIRSTAEARSEYYNDKAARVLYGSAEHPRRWHYPSRRVMGDIEVVGVEAVRAPVGLEVQGPEARGLVAIHLKLRHGSPITLLRVLAGRRNAPCLDYDPQALLDGQAVIEPASRPFTISFVTPGARRLPRLYWQPRYWRWTTVEQWLWTLASRTTLADYPPDPRNLEPREDEVIRLSSDWHAIVLRDGMGVTGTRPDRGQEDPFFGYAELYLRSIYLDAILLGLMQQQSIADLEKRMAAALDSSLTATMADLEGQVSAFRHQLWAQHLTPHGIPNRLLTAYQRQHALRERFEQILLDISDFNRLNRDEENRYVNNAVVVFTLATVPTGIALALLQVLETHNPWLFAAVGFACAALTAVLLRTRTARLALRALRRRFTIT